MKEKDIFRCSQQNYIYCSLALNNKYNPLYCVNTFKSSVNTYNLARMQSINEYQRYEI